MASRELTPMYQAHRVFEESPLRLCTVRRADGWYTHGEEVQPGESVPLPLGQEAVPQVDAPQDNKKAPNQRTFGSDILNTVRALFSGTVGAQSKDTIGAQSNGTIGAQSNGIIGAQSNCTIGAPIHDAVIEPSTGTVIAASTGTVTAPSTGTVTAPSTDTLTADTSDTDDPDAQAASLPPLLVEPQDARWTERRYLFRPRQFGRFPVFEDVYEDHAHQYYRFRNEPTVYEAQKHTAEYLRAHLNRARYQFVAAPDNRFQKYFKHKRGAIRHDQELMEEWELTGGAVDEEDRLASMHDKSEKNWEPALYTRVLIETLPPQGAWTWDEVRAYEEEVEAARIYEEELRVYEEAVRVHNEQVRVYEEKMEKRRVKREKKARREAKEARRLEEEAFWLQSEARRAEDRARRVKEEQEDLNACQLEQGAGRAEVEAGKALSDPQEKCTFAGGLLTSCRTLLSGW